MVEQPPPQRKKPRRYTAPSQTVSDSVVLGAFAMPHGAGRPDPASKTPPGKILPGKADHGETPQGEKPASAKANASAVKAAAAAPVLPERAAEDDPRRWGDAEDDLGEWMKSQRPPHWD